MEKQKEIKRLYRSRDERMLAGVCGGIAEYLNMDPTLIRLIFVLCTILGFGSMIAVYLIMWWITPLKPE